MEELLSFDWSEIQPVLIKLAVAFALALPVGWEREKRTVLMGIRTFPIVAMATCGYILMTADFAVGNQQAQARVIQGLITGMGFIGGGAILKRDDGVRGTATAASLWATGAIGASVAYGRLEIAVALAGVLFLTLRILTPVKHKVAPAAAREDGEGASDQAAG